MDLNQMRLRSSNLTDELTLHLSLSLMGRHFGLLLVKNLNHTLKTHTSSESLRPCKETIAGLEEFSHPYTPNTSFTPLLLEVLSLPQPNIFSILEENAETGLHHS